MYASCVVRQPVFDRSNALLGYEIRFPENEDGRQALSRSILSGTFDVFRGGLPAFVSCNRTQLLDSTFQSVDPKHVILLLSNDVSLDDEVVAALQKVKEAGGYVALDSLRSDPSPSEALAEYVEWVRVDLSDDNPEMLGRICDRVWHARPRFLADQVLEESQYDIALEMGFDGFQGPLFSRAEPVPAAEMPSSTVAAMRLLGLARDPNVSDRALEDAVSLDPVLTFQLLRLVNSAAVGVKGVSSIGHALRIIGRASFLRWLSLAIAASRGAKTGVDQHLVRQAVERGRLLEGMSGKGRDAGTLFLVGLFSLMDAVFRLPMHDIVSRVALSDDAKEALLERTGPYAQALAFAEAYELGMFESAAQHAEEMGVAAEKLPDIYSASISWTAEALGSMSAPVPAANERKRVA